MDLTTALPALNPPGQSIPMRALKSWLREQTPEPSTALYRYRRFRTAPVDAMLRTELQEYAREAHRDAVRQLRSILGDPLAPFPAAAPGFDPDPGSGYPYALDSNTLQGYFGELLAAAMVQHLAPFGEDGWEVPAFRWRVNVFEIYQALDAYRFDGGPPPKVFGAHGDDCTAFRLAGSGERITHYLVCECKCTTGHSATLIANAHAQISKTDPTAMDIPQLIAVLRDGPPELRARWEAPLWKLYYGGGPLTPRRHVVLYVHQQLPVAKESWIRPDEPHEKYTAKEPLEVFEVHVDDVAGLIGAVYGEEPAWNH